MRADPVAFALANSAVAREPRYVVQIIFSSSSPSFTDRSGIANVPGSVYEGCVKSISSISQQVLPEEGRATIGSVTVELVENAAVDITAEFYDQLINSNEGIRDREMRIYTGFSDDFTGFVRVATAYVDGIEYKGGTWKINARDKSRELRKQVMAVKETRLNAALDAATTTISVEDTSDFEMIAHGASFTDAPSATVGYAKVEQTGEIFRYTGKTLTTFTGVTRGVFNTKAQAIEFDPSDPRERWPEITEYVYLELPGPLMALTLMIGDMNPTGAPNTVPDHWHTGLTWPDDFDSAVWENIGADLWNPADVTAGFPIRFAGIGESDGKSFLEKEIYQLLGVYAPVTLDGRISLRRVNRVIQQNSSVRTLHSQRIIRHGELRYDQNAVVNQFRIDYNWNGDEYTRTVLITDAASIARHGAAEPKVLKFKGLHTARHTERAIKDRLAVLRDRYGEPPLRLNVTAAPSMNGLEIGDVVTVQLAALLDYTTGGTLLRAFEVQRAQLDWIRGTVDLELIASARLIESQTDNDDNSAPVPDVVYTLSGTNIATLPGYSAGHLTSNVTLTGSATALDDPNSIWYHDGDLTIDNGVTITIQNQAQLRIKGFLQVNGKIDGAGRGYAGAVDTDSVGSPSSQWTFPGIQGFIGPTRAADGVWMYLFDVYDIDPMANIEGVTTESRNKQTVAPRLTVIANQSGIYGIPLMLQGTSGGRGGQLIDSSPSSTPVGYAGTVRAKGGSGGASGAGLLIVCRGLGFGVSGQIDLSGLDGTAGQKGTVSGVGKTVWDALSTRQRLIPDWVFQAGAGAGGMPGTLYVLLDGDSVPYPDLNANTLICRRGATPVAGVSPADLAGDWYNSPFVKYPIPRYDIEGRGVDVSPLIYLTGANEDVVAAAANIWPVAHSVQYIAALGTPVEQQVPAPGGLAAVGGVGIVTLSWTPPGAPALYTEIFASAVNDRGFAEEAGQVSGTSFTHHLPNGGVRYYWVRAKDAEGRISSWYPSSASAGILAVAQDSGIDIRIYSSLTRVWNADASAPGVWNPTQPYTDVVVEVLQFGDVIAQERIRVTLDTATGNLTWAYIANDANITVIASATPANTIRFEFTHVPTGLIATDEYVAVRSGAPGPPGPAGSLQLTVRANYQGFNQPASGWLYIHGFDDLGNPADTSGDIGYNGVPLTIGPGSVRTVLDQPDGAWLILDTSLTATFSHDGSLKYIAAARKTRQGWRYDNGTDWTTFTATATMIIIGSVWRNNAQIMTVTLWDSGIALNVIPFERADQVQPGDLTPGAIDDLTAFASTLRPVSVVSSLPGLPSTSYPNGALVYLTSDRKVYRNDNSSWIKSVDGADITAGTITAAALAADIVIGTLFRTASSGARVEMQGGGHVFPFWIGTGTKGASSGSPGSGARLWYDRVADRLGMTGRLVAASVQANSSNAFSVTTAGGYPASLFSVLTMQGYAAIAASGAYTTVATSPLLYSPDNSGGGIPQYRRLQDNIQPFIFDMLHTTQPITSDGAPGLSTAEFKVQYAYDGGAFSDVAGTVQLSVYKDSSNVFPQMSGRWMATFQPKATPWNTLQLRMQAREIHGIAAFTSVQGQVAIPNLGTQGLPANMLT